MTKTFVGRVRTRTILTALAVGLACPTAALAQNTSFLSENGWFSDDTRADGFGSEAAGTNLVSSLLTDDPEATASGSAAHDADIMSQITFGPAPGVVPAGTWPGAMHLQIGAENLGKTQISHRKDDGVGHAPGSVFGPGFSAEYSWMGDGPTSITASLKFGVKTSEFGSAGVSSRTGENAWDKVLIYEPGNLNGGTSDGTWQTETVTHTSGKWWFFDRVENASIIGTPMTLADMAVSTTPVGTRTAADIYALIVGGHITSVQFGIGSYNMNGSVYVNQLETNAYRAGSVTTFGSAPLICDGDVTNAVIYGSGNANGSFTLARNNGVEIGLRGKLRFPAPMGVYNSNGDGTYTFQAGAATSGAGWITPATPIWNFDWSVNTDWDGSTGDKLADLTYELGMDFDPGPGVDYLTFDPFATGGPITYWDHSIGDNSTPDNGGAEAGDAPTYLALIGANNLGQNSWNYEFFNDAPFDTFDPNVPGRYEIYLAAFDGGVEVSRGQITMIVEAPVSYDDDVTPDAIFGSGNGNGSFTVERNDGVEIGLRGKLRFPASGTYNSNGDGTYTFDAVAATSGAGWITAETPIWNYEWSINTDWDGSTGRKLDDLTYEIGIDFDPGAGTNYLVFDPLAPNTVFPYTVPVLKEFWDHSIGTNATPNGGGAEAGDLATYLSLIAANNVAQQSWNIEFNNEAPFSGFDPTTPGHFEVYLAAFDGADEVVRSAITIVTTAGTSLTLEGDACQTDQDCNLPGTQIAVELWGRNLAGPATGFQAFLAYDEDLLTYEGAASSYADNVFSGHVQDIATADVATDELRLDGFVGFGSGDSISDDTLLATLVFTVAAECSPATVVFDGLQPFDSELSNLGMPLATALVDSSPIAGDATPPVLAPSADISVAADASVGSGCDSAVVEFATPAATDNCPEPVSVQCFPPSGTAFPAGETTTVTCLATDGCGNTSTSTFDVTVSSTNVVDLTVDLVGVTATATRCIRFVTDDCGSFVDIPLDFVGGEFTGSIEVPCGNWTELCVKDQQHTLWTTVPLALDGTGTKYVATSTVELESGDTDDDGDVDINDVTLFLAQFGLFASPGGCPWDGVTRDADFDLDGAIGSTDYPFLVDNWLTATMCSCTVPSVGPTAGRSDGRLAFARVDGPLTDMADLNRDGWVDHRDVELLERTHGLDGRLSDAMRAAGQGARR